MFACGLMIWLGASLGPIEVAIRPFAWIVAFLWAGGVDGAEQYMHHEAAIVSYLGGAFLLSALVGFAIGAAIGGLSPEKNEAGSVTT